MESKLENLQIRQSGLCFEDRKVTAAAPLNNPKEENCTFVQCLSLFLYPEGHALKVGNSAEQY